MKQSIQTHEDERWIYGYSISDTGERLSDWMKLKHPLWVTNKFQEIIQNMKIPLNNEMMKQISKYEGDTHFLYKLNYMTKSDQIQLTDKQVNFMARFLIANEDISVWALKHFVITGFQAGKSNKDIELKMKEIREKHENQ